MLDLTGMARIVIARTWSPYEFFVTIGIVYLLLTYGVIWCFARFERYLYRHLKREGVRAGVHLGMTIRGNADDRRRDHQANHHAGWLGYLMWLCMYATCIPATLRDKYFDMAGMVGTTGRTQHRAGDIQ